MLSFKDTRDISLEFLRRKIKYAHIVRMQNARLMAFVAMTALKKIFASPLPEPSSVVSVALREGESEGSGIDKVEEMVSKCSEAVIGRVCRLNVFEGKPGGNRAVELKLYFSLVFDPIHE
jgi:hypothetical protein